MVRSTVFFAIALLNTAVAVPPRHDAKAPSPASLAENIHNNNASLVRNFFDQPVLDISGSDLEHWRLPDIFKRQATCVNYCGPTQSAPKSYCGCGQSCCAGGGCCSTATGAICCGAVCCISGATCNATRVCAARTVVLSVTATATSILYRDSTSFVTAVDGTLTITSTFSSVTIVTISSADIATSVVTATVTKAAARRARDPGAVRPVDIPEQPLETATPSPNAGKAPPQVTHDAAAPHITSKPGSAQAQLAARFEKRQNIALTTVTSTIATITVPIISTRVFTSTVSGRATATASTTIWQTVTSVVNARTTVTSTTMYTFIPNVPTTTSPSTSPSTTTSSVSTGAGNNDNPNASSNPVPQSGSGSLSKGAQAGIGAGTGAGSLIICLLLGFCYRRRRKSRKEREQTMIQSAVTSAMAAQQKQQQQVPLPPLRHQNLQQDHDKHLSGTTFSASYPHHNSYSPSPPLHAPQSGYVYPPPQSLQQHQSYDTNPMAFPEAMGPHSPHSSMAPPYGGSEMDGQEVRRYELPLYASPQPTLPGPYSDLPEVRR